MTVRLPHPEMKALVLLGALLCLSSATLNCTTLCKAPSYVDKGAKRYNEEEAIVAVLCHDMCQHNVSAT